MGWNHNRLAFVGIAVLLALAAGGCSSAVGVWPVAQSHVSYPGTTIVPIGEAKGSASDWFFTFGGVVDLMHPDIPQEAVREAIREKKANLLTDYTLSLRVTRIGIPIIESLTFWWITWTAEGTAAKVEYVNPEPTPPEAGKAPKS